MFRLILTAVALGLSNFAAAIGIGLAGIDARVRVRVALVFGVFEAGMPILGLAIGRGFATTVGSTGRYVGGVLLIATGLYTAWRARRADPHDAPEASSVGPLVLTGAALSIDNLIVGFALGTTKASLVVAVPLIASVSVGLSLIGLELGDRLGVVIERRSGEIGGVVLVLVGLAVVAGVL
jgi:putative Mn2+ efflux pump MntP